MTYDAVPAAAELTGSELGVDGDAIWHHQVAGDVTADGAADVVIAVWSASTGQVVLVQGAPGTGIVARPAQTWSQSTPGVKGVDRPEDGFGTAVAIGRFGAGNHSSVAIGAPAEKRGQGRVTVLKGSEDGLTARGTVCGPRTQRASRAAPSVVTSSARLSADPRPMTIAGRFPTSEGRCGMTATRLSTCTSRDGARFRIYLDTRLTPSDRRAVLSRFGLTGQLMSSTTTTTASNACAPDAPRG